MFRDKCIKVCGIASEEFFDDFFFPLENANLSKIKAVSRKGSVLMKVSFQNIEMSHVDILLKQKGFKKSKLTCLDM